MKKILLLAFGLMLGSLAHAQNCIDILLNKGITEYNAGNYAAAKIKWQSALTCSDDITNSQKQVLNDWINKADNPPSVYKPSVTTSQTRQYFEPEMVTVQGGTFQMGGLDKDASSDEKPVHSVTLNSFLIGKYEVTFDEYDKFCDDTGREKPSDKGWGRGKRPVINVSFSDAKAYCAWLTGKTERKYRLPTEAEWEYAARGGENNIFSSAADIDDAAWYSGNSDKKTHPVGGKSANAFGLFDMTGNVWEWCNDWYDENYYKNSPTSNPQGASSGSDRVYRGGSWFDTARGCRVTNRGGFTPTLRDYDLGFRVVLSSSR